MADQVQVEIPRGMYPARVDDKGRLKLPVGFARYFESLTEKTLYATSLDRAIGQIYTLEAWRENEKLFENNSLEVELIQQFEFNAAELGSETEMDSQGRILLSPELRRQLGIENQTVHLYRQRNHIDILNEKAFNELKQKAASVTRQDYIKAVALGLK